MAADVGLLAVASARSRLARAASGDGALLAQIAARQDDQLAFARDSLAKRGSGGARLGKPAHAAHAVAPARERYGSLRARQLAHARAQTADVVAPRRAALMRRFFDRQALLVLEQHSRRRRLARAKPAQRFDLIAPRDHVEWLGALQPQTQPLQMPSVAS